jgi:2-polyprenyl-3-methyl-5-hydroxy-6-metoxy-1,4-benzoquinol methylase
MGGGEAIVRRRVSAMPDTSEGAGGYYGQSRPDLVAALPRPLGRVLDVGCGEGGVGRGLRAAGATWLSGIELVPDAAERARAVYDEVLVGTADDTLESVTGPFDTICCYDVLEHMPDPYTVLRRLRKEVAAPGARVHVSVPNARHWTLFRDLLVRGTFGYADWGHRDRTHLRWFTGRDIAQAVTDAGWQDAELTHPALGRSRSLARLTRGRSTEFLTAQWYVLAHKPR